MILPQRSVDRIDADQRDGTQYADEAAADTNSRGQAAQAAVFGAMVERQFTTTIRQYLIRKSGPPKGSHDAPGKTSNHPTAPLRAATTTRSPAGLTRHTNKPALSGQTIEIRAMVNSWQ